MIWVLVGELERGDTIKRGAKSVCVYTMYNTITRSIGFIK